MLSLIKLTETVETQILLTYKLVVSIFKSLTKITRKIFGKHNFEFSHVTYIANSHILLYRFNSTLLHLSNK